MGWVLALSQAALVPGAELMGQLHPGERALAELGTSAPPGQTAVVPCLPRARPAPQSPSSPGPSAPTHTSPRREIIASRVRAAAALCQSWVLAVTAHRAWEAALSYHPRDLVTAVCASTCRARAATVPSWFWSPRLQLSSVPQGPNLQGTPSSPEPGQHRALLPSISHSYHPASWVQAADFRHCSVGGPHPPCPESQFPGTTAGLGGPEPSTLPLRPLGQPLP